MEGGKGAEGGSGARPKGKGASAVGQRRCIDQGIDRHKGHIDPGLLGFAAGPRASARWG